MKEVTYKDNYAYVDGYKFRRDDKTGYYLSTKRINGNRLRLHVYMWVSRRGDIPKGHEIHHGHGDKSNNEVSNLECMTRKEHNNWHTENITEERLVKNRINIKKAQEKAVEWHGSPEGIAWHRKHGAVTLNGGKKFDLTCGYCNQPYKSKRQWSKFCTPKCQTRFRYHSGIDNETRVCFVCGKDFEVNKYLKTKTCSKLCAQKMRRAT